ncbi:nitroreductase/quinone reductase family protein [Saccharopolyspora erythraea]|uniref:nitroreductase/quinone reductase family protein n=1 Tax=Saccharopolyspora erythraea TaxID=1836 RepID=UPI002012D1A8|nr:nitroreductase/quinone reductase family protein [Saccharopolyspora erythraea]
MFASNSGAPKSPAWCNNVVAHPQVTVELRGDRYEARAEQVFPANTTSCGGGGGDRAGFRGVPTPGRSRHPDGCPGAGRLTASGA